MSAVGSENPETLPEEMVQEEANAKSSQTSYRDPAQPPPSWRWFSQLKLLDLELCKGYLNLRGRRCPGRKGL